MKNNDRLSSIILLGVAAFFYYLTYSIPIRATTSGLGATFFPRVVLGLIMILAIIQFILSFLTTNKKIAFSQSEEQTKDGKHTSFLVGSIFALFAVYIFLVTRLGFVLSSFAFIVIVYLLLAPYQALKKRVFAFGFLFVMVLFLKLIFQNILGVPLPKGLLF